MTLNEYKELCSDMELRIIKELKHAGLRGIEHCTDDINNLYRVSAIISALEQKPEPEHAGAELLSILDGVISTNPKVWVVVSKFVASNIHGYTGYSIAPLDTLRIHGETYPMGSYKELIINVDTSMPDSDRRILIYEGDRSLVGQVLIPIGTFNKLK